MVRRFPESAARDLDLYNACYAYDGRFDGENHFDSYSNGELALMRFAPPHCRVGIDVGANRGRWIDVALTVGAQAALASTSASASEAAASSSAWLYCACQSAKPATE